MHSQIHLYIDTADASLVGKGEVMSTISKVAERAGVSRTTVSHVINHADRVSKPLRERVQAAIEELGYSPNPQAASLRTGRTNIVAMLIPDILNSYFTEMVKTVQAELERFGFDTLIFNTDVPGGHPERHAREYLRQLGRKRVDGLIVGEFALHGLNEVLEQIAMPAVYVGNRPSPYVDSIGLDEYDGAYRLGAYLTERGHTRVASVTGPSIFSEAMTRAAGFEAGLAAGGHPLEAGLRFEGTYLAPSGQEAARWIAAMPREKRPTAVFFAAHLMARGALAEFYDLGIKVPDDIAVAVFDDVHEFEYVRPRLTRIGKSPSVLARHATKMLLDRLGGRFDGGPRSEIIPCTLQVFESA